MRWAQTEAVASRSVAATLLAAGGSLHKQTQIYISAELTAILQSLLAEWGLLPDTIWAGKTPSTPGSTSLKADLDSLDQGTSPGTLKSPEMSMQSHWKYGWQTCGAFGVTLKFGTTSLHGLVHGMSLYRAIS